MASERRCGRTGVDIDVAMAEAVRQMGRIQSLICTQPYSPERALGAVVALASVAAALASRELDYTPNDVEAMSIADVGLAAMDREIKRRKGLS